MKAVSLAAAIVMGAATPAFAQHLHEPSASLQQPGQAAFAVIQEVVTHLETDPSTDWSQVNVEGLRQHLIDMDEVALRAEIRMEPISGGARFHVSGAGRTREAIQRMVIAHAHAQGQTEHWRLTAEPTPGGAMVTAIAVAPADVQRIRALGLLGVMASGAHHQSHHWAIARGDNPHH